MDVEDIKNQIKEALGEAEYRLVGQNGGLTSLPQALTVLEILSKHGFAPQDSDELRQYLGMGHVKSFVDNSKGSTANDVRFIHLASAFLGQINDAHKHNAAFSTEQQSEELITRVVVLHLVPEEGSRTIFDVSVILRSDSEKAPKILPIHAMPLIRDWLLGQEITPNSKIHFTLDGAGEAFDVCLPILLENGSYALICMDHDEESSTLLSANCISWLNTLPDTVKSFLPQLTGIINQRLREKAEN